jgi:hypothetical protein
MSQQDDRLSRRSAQVSIMRGRDTGAGNAGRVSPLARLIAELRAQRPVVLDEAAQDRVWRAIEGRIAWGLL